MITLFLLSVNILKRLKPFLEHFIKLGWRICSILQYNSYRSYISATIDRTKSSNLILAITLHSPCGRTHKFFPYFTQFFHIRPKYQNKNHKYACITNRQIKPQYHRPVFLIRIRDTAISDSSSFMILINVLS